MVFITNRIDLRRIFVHSLSGADEWALLAAHWLGHAREKAGVATWWPIGWTWPKLFGGRGPLSSRAECMGHGGRCHFRYMCIQGPHGWNNVQQWYLWSLQELPNTGTVSSVVIINLFSIPQHKSFHGSFFPCARTGFQKQFQLKNKVLFFNFQAICIRVSVVYLASTLVFTYLFKGKKCLDMIYGLQQERNFLCAAPNLKGCGVRSHWPYQYHRPALERGWIFIQSVSSDLWYALLVDNTFHFTLQRTKNPTT